MIVIDRVPSEEYLDIADLNRSISVNIEIKRKNSSIQDSKPILHSVKKREISIPLNDSLPMIIDF